MQLTFSEKDTRQESFFNEPIFLGSYFLFSKLGQKYGQSQLQTFYEKNSAGIPYFEDYKQLVNLEKTFFFLDDDKNFQPSLFHHGRFFYQKHFADSKRIDLKNCFDLFDEMIEKRVNGW